jgi:molybdopterin-guanine dinucleotide biosynthesis adapter protein
MRIIGFAGWSGAGKTHVLRLLLPVLVERGLSVSTLKHAHHTFDIDHAGKDSYIHREAGAQEVLIASSHRLALMRELRGAPEPGLDELVLMLKPVDLVLVEGFKGWTTPKIEIHRTINAKPFLYPDDPLIRMLASDEKPVGFKGDWCHVDDIEALAEGVLKHAVARDDLLQTLKRRAGAEA